MKSSPRALNHQNIVEMAQGHISLSNTARVRFLGARLRAAHVGGIWRWAGAHAGMVKISRAGGGGEVRSGESSCGYIRRRCSLLFPSSRYSFFFHPSPLVRDQRRAAASSSAWCRDSVVLGICFISGRSASYTSRSALSPLLWP
jgi:hypothetical protein